MGRLKRLGCLFVFAVSLTNICSFNAFAQSIAAVNDAAQRSGQIQREQLLRQQNDIDRQLQNRRPQTNIEVTPPPVPQGHGTGCRNIWRIEFKSTVHMTYKEFLALAKPATGHCLGVDDIQRLLSETTKFYVDKGYVTARVYLPAQDLSTGILQIKVVEGKVSDLKIDQDHTQLNYLGNIFPGVVGEDLNLRDFEQGIDQINRLLSNNASIDIQPGANAGDSIVTIKNSPTKFWHANVTADNYGTPTTGRDQLGETVSLDNLTGLNDFLSITERNTVPFDRRSKQARSTSGLFSIPYGYLTLTGGITGSDYNSTLHTAGGTDLPLKGDDRLIYTTLDDVVYRDQNGKASLNATLTNEKTDSYISDQKLSVSSRTLSILQVGGNYDTSLWGGSFNLGLDYARGLKIFDALHDQSGLPGSVPKAEFNKYLLSAGYSKPFTAAQQKLLFSTQFSGQYSPNTLYGSEQISVGGMYSVRGFFEEALANDDGLYLRNDLTLIKSLGTVFGHDVGLRPFWALDFGSVGSRNNANGDSGTLAGTALGFDLASGPVDLNVFSGYPLIYPTDVHNERFNTFARLSVTF